MPCKVTGNPKTKFPLLNNDFRSQHDKFVYDDGVQFLDLKERTKVGCTQATFDLKRVKGEAIVV